MDTACTFVNPSETDMRIWDEIGALEIAGEEVSFRASEDLMMILKVWVRFLH